MQWLPFDLHPEYPPEGIPRSELHTRYGEPFHDRLQATFEAAGLAYNPPPDVVPNSRLALRLTELARDRGLHDRAHDRLMEAYWAEARDIGDPGVLRELAADVGLDGEEVDRVIEGGDYLERVQASTREAQSLGINGIPAWIIDRRLLVLGAQPQQVFEQAFARLESAGDGQEPVSQ